MSNKQNTGIILAAVLVSFGAFMPRADAQPPRLDKPMDLLNAEDLNQAWREPTGTWKIVGDTFIDPNNEKLLGFAPGGGTVLNGPEGKTDHLVSQLEHGDVKLHVEFMVPKGSNSGIYFQGRYEIQILDSWGVATPGHGDCGGIYQRWHEEPGIEDSQRGYEGHAPKTNASKEPGQWQTFDVIFRAPRFDESGKKTADAEFVKVEHNGSVVHENVKLSGPTRSAMAQDEQPFGPLMIQGDHGPVSFRNLHVEPLSEGGAAN
ncbi:MAG: DUF1080 domain-containing protein [Candidatus Hydrogenedentes bacterium]|nr:DUF1080 domain-containing protein [Candidatus Hydrogenedentota bacterium]